MATRYRRTFEFVDTEEQAKKICDEKNKNRYIREHHKAIYTSWVSQDRTERKFVVLYSTK